MNFWTKLNQKGYFQSKEEKRKNQYQIRHIGINVGANFQLQQTILIFRTKLATKKDTSGQEQKEKTLPLNYSYSN